MKNIIINLDLSKETFLFTEMFTESFAILYIIQGVSEVAHDLA